ncbi:DUF5666 domain-containing protein [Nocardia sp. CNY236]|uniref:DUF5666 domain-containing protein n=1 Tax=Nocardia sp. CNY236 TaxID=1169152 RepID=UPI00041BEF00|nr:DUF5666 domain-containing protein [Nocardia sp. CNY236]
MTTPNDPWSQRPEDAPTEHLGPTGKSGYGDPARPTDYAAPYDAAAPAEYPPTEQMGSWAPPGPNATREFPPYDPSWAAYHGSAGDRPTDTAVLPGGGMPPVQPPPEQTPLGQKPPRRNTGLWIALGVSVLVLVGVLGLAAGVMLAGGNSGSTDTAAGPSASAPTSSLPDDRTVEPPPGGGLPTVPDFGEFGGLTAAMGTITANNGETLTVSTVLGDTVTVRTDADTEVISLSATTVADLPTGELVLVQGNETEDGSLLATVIISTSLPGGR